MNFYHYIIQKDDMNRNKTRLMCESRCRDQKQSLNRAPLLQKLSDQSEHFSQVSSTSRPQVPSSILTPHLANLFSVQHLEWIDCFAGRIVTMPATIAGRLLLRRPQHLIARRPAFRQASTTAKATDMASETASKAKETASNTASQASRGLSRVSSSAGSGLSRAGQGISRTLGRLGGRTKRLITFVESKYKIAILSAVRPLQ